MKAHEMDTVLQILTEANPSSIFLELAFLESYVSGAERRRVGIPLEMVEAALPFFEAECRWKPRLGPAIYPHPAWLRVAAAAMAAGVLIGSPLH